MLIDKERAKYAELWSTVPEYRGVLPGLLFVKHFFDVLDPPSHASIIDLGCGTGTAGVEFAKRGLDVHWLDFTDAGLDPQVPRDRFIEAALWAHWRGQARATLGWDYGYCTDVMEHIPTEYVALVIDNVLSACRQTWFQIATVTDNCGSLIGETLHLTVRPFTWWRDTFLTLGAAVTDARDLGTDAMFIVSRHHA